jgi:hypothetical protein
MREVADEVAGTRSHSKAYSWLRPRRFMSIEYPAELEVRSSDGRSAHYRLAPDFHARPSSAAQAGSAKLVQKLDDNFSVFQGPSSPSDLAEGKTLPVYRAEPSGAFAIPTGRVWVRFKEGIDAAAKHVAIAKAGFHLEESPAWAKHAAWLRAGSGKIADALSAARRLVTLGDVEHVEPQMLTAVARKE